MTESEKRYRHETSVIIQETLCRMERREISKAEALEIIGQRQRQEQPQSEFFNAVRQLVEKVASGMGA